MTGSEPEIEPHIPSAKARSRPTMSIFMRMSAPFPIKVAPHADRGSWLTLFAITLPFVLGSLAIGALISAFARNSAQSVFLSVFFILPSFVLSGVMMPYQLMPDGVRQIGGLLPLRWYQIAIRRIVERGAGPAEVAIPALALTTIFAVALGLVVWRMKPRLA